MCLYTLKEMPEKLITTKHYVAYKRLYSTVRNRKQVYCPPFYTYFIYEPGKLYEIGSLRSRTGWKPGERIVERGFHAYRDIATAKLRRYRYGGEVIRPCIVPAGSEVFYGKHGEVVSNKLIVFRDIDQLNKWCANNPVT